MILPEYLFWHYNTSLKKLILIYRNIIIFYYHYFGIPFHLKTLFYPWKRQLIGKSRPGFHLDDILGTISFNLISRFIGAFIRIITIFSGFVVIAITLLVGLLIIILFVFSPLVWFPVFLIGKAKNPSKGVEILRYSGLNLHKLLLNILSSSEGAFIFEHIGLLPENISTFLNTIYDLGDYPKFKNNLNPQETNLSVADLIVSLAQTYSVLGKLLSHYEISITDIQKASDWYKKLHQEKRKPPLTDLSSLLRIPGIGRDWAYGFTPDLDKYSSPLATTYALFTKIVGRDKEIAAIERILTKTSQNSLIMVGEPGVGRHAIVYGFSQLVATDKCLPSLFGKRILTLDLKSITAGKDQLTAKKEIAQIFKEAKTAGNIILVVDNFDKYVSVGQGRIDLTDVFSESLTDGRLQIIAITEPQGFHQFILPNTTLMEMFEKLEIEIPSSDIVLDELEISVAPVLEQKHDIIIPYQALIETIKDAEKYESINPFPEKAIDLLEETIVFVKSKKNPPFLHPTDIQEFLSVKTKIPIGDLSGLEKEKLENLESLIHQQIINQENAVTTIADALRRARTGISTEEKPLGSFLFLGPTGVGKTETAKALARIYYGSQDRILRFDMSQYQSEEGLHKLIGSPQTGSPGELTRKIRDNPFSLLLLDEIEKADNKIYNLFLTLLDEGYIEDNSGRRVDARNLMIIATSNAGSEYIREQVLQGITKDKLHDKLVDFIQKEKIFSPEFLNRFDQLVVFTPLSEGNLREVAKLMLEKLNLQLAKQGISLTITDQLVKSLTTIGFDPVFGARAIRRTIDEKIENQIAKKILSGEAKKGSQITIDPDKLA